MMKIKMTFITMVLLCLFITSVSAKKWRVNNALTVPTQVDFNELLDAVASNDVNSGDTIYVEGSAIEYIGGIEVNKQLTILGPGYLLNQDNLQPTSCNRLHAMIGLGGITFGFGSDGSYISGMTISPRNSSTNSISIEKTSNITITSNRVANIVFLTGQNDDINNCSDIIISKNLICSTNSISIRAFTLVNNFTVRNNLISGGFNNSNISSDITNGLIINNIVNGFLNINGSNIAFNYIDGIDADEDNISVNNNIFNTDNSDSQTIVASDPSNVIDPYDLMNASCDSDNWTFSPSDQTTTHGAYNGFDPFYSDNPISPANLPTVPVMYDCSVQPCGDQSIQIEINVRVNN